MPVNHANVRNLLRATLRDTVGFPDEGEHRTSWVGELFEAPESGLWIREAYMIAGEDVVATQLIEATGIYQVDVYAPEGTGTEEAETLAEAIRDQFPYPGSLQDADTSTNVEIYKAERSTAKIERSTISVGQNFPWLNVSISIYWRTYGTTNNV